MTRKKYRRTFCEEGGNGARLPSAFADGIEQSLP